MQEKRDEFKKRIYDALLQGKIERLKALSPEARGATAGSSLSTVQGDRGRPRSGSGKRFGSSSRKRSQSGDEKGKGRPAIRVSRRVSASCPPASLFRPTRSGAASSGRSRNPTPEGPEASECCPRQAAAQTGGFGTWLLNGIIGPLGGALQDQCRGPGTERVSFQFG